MPLTHSLCGGIKSQPLLHSAQGRRRQAAIPHSSYDRSPIRQLWSLLRHPGRCGSTVGPATRDKTCSALLPSLFCQLRPTGLYLITRMAPGPPPAWEGARCRHEPLEEGCPSLVARVPDLAPRGVRDLHVSPRPPSVHASTPSMGSGTAAYPATTGARRTPTCRAHGTPHLEACTPYSDDHTACGGLAERRRDLRRTKDDIQDDCHARRHAPQCTSYSVRPLHPHNSGGNEDFHAPLRMYTVPPCDYKRRGRLPSRGTLAAIAT